MNLKQFSQLPDAALTDTGNSVNNHPSPGQSANPGSTEREFNDTSAHITKDGMLGGSLSDRADTADPGPNKPTSGPGTISVGSLVSGKAILDVTDIAIPAIVVFICEKFSYEVDGKLLKLTTDEKKMIEPHMNNFLAWINVKLNPMWALIIVLSVTYGSKALEVIPQVKKKSKQMDIDEIRQTDNPDDVPLKDLQEQLIQHYMKKRKKKRVEIIDWMKGEEMYPLTMSNYKQLTIVLKK